MTENDSREFDLSDVVEDVLEDVELDDANFEPKPSFEPKVIRNENYAEQTAKPFKVNPQIRNSRDISIFDDEE